MNEQTVPIPTTPSRTAPENLEAGAATFRERGQVYGKSYIKFGGVMSELFPNGLWIDSRDTASHVRLGIMVQIIGKLTRYAEQMTRGGHRDSAHDMMVYSAMLEEVTEEPKELTSHAKV